MGGENEAQSLECVVFEQKLRGSVFDADPVESVKSFFLWQMTPKQIDLKREGAIACGGLGKGR